MEIIHDTENKQFILPLENDLQAKVTYTIDEIGHMRLIYSEVPTQLRGSGIGKELVLKTFEKLTEEGFKAQAICGYIRAVAMSHPKWSEIIS